jgi:uncharacterized protein
MLVIEVARIPPEGQEVAEELSPEAIHLDPREDFTLRPGARLAGRLDRGDDDAVHVVADLSASLSLACGRCLEPFELAIGQRVDAFCLPRRADEGEEEDVELSDRDMVVAYYEQGRIDLGEMVREQLYLGLPMKRLCREDCRGLCPGCGSNRNRETCDCRPEGLDPRLAPLSGLLGPRS